MIPGLSPTLSVIADFLECQKRFAGVPGRLADLEGYALLQLAAGGAGMGAVVAIGSSVGRATAFLAAGSLEAGREKVVAVSPFRNKEGPQSGSGQQAGAFGRFQESLKQLAVDDHVTVILASSADAAGQWGGPIRLLFLDGDPSAEVVRRDFERWSPFVVPHGMICLQCLPAWTGVARFYTELLNGKAGYREAGSVLNVKILQRQASPPAADGQESGSGVSENNRGVQLLAQSRFVEAEAAFRQALALEPNLPAAPHYNLAKALQAQEKLAAAAVSYQRALKFQPDWIECHLNLGQLYFLQRRLSDAEACYRQVLRLQPNHLAAMVSLGANVLTYSGRTKEAHDLYEQVLAQYPEEAGCRSNMLLNEQYLPGVSLAGLSEAHAVFERKHADALSKTWKPFANRRDPDRPLRLGLVSADFYLHPVGLFLAPVLGRLQAPEWFTVCYGNQRKNDEQTERLRKAAGLWRNVTELNDEALAEQIRADAIDLLLDLSGHTGGNRLLTFARRPAPVQLTWMAYVGTTGLKAMDYLIADRYHIPDSPDTSVEKNFSEQVLRLPDGYICYEPMPYAPAVGRLPALAGAPVTFGGFHNPAKITPVVIATWADILRQVPASQLLLKSHFFDDAELRRRLTEQFAAHGIAATRLEMVGHTNHRQQLEHYNRVDIALDTFPYSGGLTTCEASWMGVPVVSCPGETFASRHSLSHLSNLGMTGTIVADLAEYVRVAVGLAQDLPRLAELRAGLRPRMAASPLCDADRFASHLAAALRQAWRKFCANAR